MLTRLTGRIRNSILLRRNSDDIKIKYDNILRLCKEGNLNIIATYYESNVSTLVCYGYNIFEYCIIHCNLDVIQYFYNLYKVHAIRNTVILPLSKHYNVPKLKFLYDVNLLDSQKLIAILMHSYSSGIIENVKFVLSINKEYINAILDDFDLLITNFYSFYMLYLFDKSILTHDLSNRLVEYALDEKCLELIIVLIYLNKLKCDDNLIYNVIINKLEK